jgi:hypothetical protein
MLIAALLALGTGALAAAGEMKMELGSDSDRKLFSARFARYGYNPFKTIVIDPKGGVRFRLPSGAKDIPQTGIYSFFAIAGDFEIVTTYDWTDVTPPREGYGMSCGLAIELDGKAPVGQLRSVSVARGHLPGKPGEVYLVTREVVTEDKSDYQTEHFPIRAKKGKLGMRREKDEVILLVAENLKDELRELARVTFTEATIRKTRLYADPGGSATFMDVKFLDFHVRAEEVTGGIPLRDQKFAWAWWLTFGGFVLVGTVLFILYRREKRRQYEDDEPAPVKKPAPAKKPAPTNKPAPTSIRPGRPQ